MEADLLRPHAVHRRELALVNRSAEERVKLFGMTNQLLEHDLDRIEREYAIDLQLARLLVLPACYRRRREVHSRFRLVRLESDYEEPPEPGCAKFILGFG